MQFKDREELIRKLADQAGMTDQYNTKYAGSRYDSNTGTFYCEGIVVTHNSVVEAQNYYKHQMEHYKAVAAKDKSMTNQYIFAAVAYNAITMMADDGRSKVMKEN
ncbi:MAG: hypothetical protein K6F35_06690 [Lachnospiraceae bacterium]|nr:hypothetical protein [Lachnospiraceae bacterium]